jgi:hypothetical protein
MKPDFMFYRTGSVCIQVGYNVKQLSHFGNYEFDVRVTMQCDKFLTLKPTRCTNSSNLSWNETLHVSDSSSVHHQEFFTLHTAMLNVTQVCRQLAGRIRVFHPDPACKLSAKLYDIYLLLCVQWKTPDDGQRNCSKHVEFHSKINLTN